MIKSIYSTGVKSSVIRILFPLHDNNQNIMTMQNYVFIYNVIWKEASNQAQKYGFATCFRNIVNSLLQKQLKVIWCKVQSKKFTCVKNIKQRLCNICSLSVHISKFKKLWEVRTIKSWFWFTNFISNLIFFFHWQTIKEWSYTKNLKIKNNKKNDRLVLYWITRKSQKKKIFHRHVSMKLEIFCFQWQIKILCQ